MSACLTVAVIEVGTIYARLDYVLFNNIGMMQDENTHSQSKFQGLIADWDFYTM
jgi:CRISPR/Cas system CMR-associated protein Cmr3 (group 5 of RAMP superfamily)